ncbi:unnamed protein product [Spodoptera littoralis]|uniref:C2H2-type domain-containing protein n=1 Tax=Spodoptera littoralis TaxID=7109 RepID=A0A9P0N6M0_SPOLI|nr:unnamed protein product [Spodoptera littoralis]CAH1643429.1 unnamed protein product [Spodoptera littoralis]
MSDEIDIEEHDIMNDPSIKSIFPDLSVIKKEINEYYEGGSNVPEDTQLEKTVIKEELDTSHSKNTNVPDVANTSQCVETQQEKVVIKKELDAIHSASNNELDVANTSQDIGLDNQQEKVVIKKELVDGTHSASNNEPDITNNSQDIKAETESDTAIKYIHENIIVLGSKPSTKYDNTDNKSIDKEAKIQLKRIDNFLESCKRYCEKCLIVFPKPNLFNLHKINKHKKQDRSLRAQRQHLNTTPKPTETKDNPNKILVGQLPQEDSTELSCFHCKQLFPNKSCLIEHLYKVLEPNEIKTNNASTPSTTNDDNNDEECADESVNNSKKSNAKQPSTVQVKNNHTTNKNDKRRLPQKILRKRKLVNKNNTNEHVPKKKCIRDDRIVYDDSDEGGKKEEELLYRCFICSKYNITYKHYSRHVITDHNIQPPTNVKKVPFDPKCTFCSSKLANMKYYNIHLYRSHRQQQKGVNFRPDRNIVQKNSYQFALKSVLFKCMKCELCFLTSDAAINHSKHKLNNTKKCSKCHRLFNSEDMAIHKNQHSQSKTFTVHTLPESASNSVLYKCSECAVHYSEEMFLKHNSKCHSETPNSSHCKICDILINSDDMQAHNLNHKKHKMLYADFIIIESEIMDNKDTKVDKATKKLKILFCKTCDCFMVKNSIVHCQGKCSHISKTICKDCGLVMSIKAHLIHRETHKKKYVSLFDYTFIDIKSKKQIIPPIPVYPKCNICGVHFLRKSAIRSHTCEEQDYISCSICSIKLTEHAYKLHIPFHSYSKPNTIRNLEDAVSL